MYHVFTEVDVENHNLKLPNQRIVTICKRYYRLEILAIWLFQSIGNSTSIFSNEVAPPAMFLMK